MKKQREIISFEIDTELYELAQEWMAIERKIMNGKKFKDIPELVRHVVIEKVNKEWKKWTKKHNLIIQKKPVKFMGMKMPQVKIKYYSKLKDIFELLRIFHRFEFGIITKKGKEDK